MKVTLTRDAGGRGRASGTLAITVLAIASLALLAAEVAAARQQSGSIMARDLAHRSPKAKWPAGLDPAQADLFSHNQIRIDAPCARVWRHIVDATSWPDWYPNSKNVRLVSGGSQLRLGTVFRWRTFGLDVESRVQDFVPGRHIGWTGGAPGAAPGFYHLWLLAPEGQSCRVTTEETGRGAAAVRLRQTDEGLMHRGHDLWLASLKWVSESR